jgi:hypothetical protein
MNFISPIKKRLPGRKFRRFVVSFLMVAAVTVMPLGLPASSATASTEMTTPRPPCYSQAASLGQLVNSVTLCWNSFTQEFEIYVSPITGATGGSCGSPGAFPVSCTGGTAYNPTGLPWEIHITPSNLTPPPGTIISITILVQIHKKPVPVTPLEYQVTFNFDSKAVMDLPSHCMQLFP